MKHILEQALKAETAEVKDSFIELALLHLEEEKAPFGSKTKEKASHVIGGFKEKLPTVSIDWKRGNKEGHYK